MGKNKISVKILTMGVMAFVALFLSMSETNASLSIESIKFIGSSADLRINVTIKNTGTNATDFNLTLEDETNEDRDRRVIFSRWLRIDGNRTQSYIFGRYGTYDHSLNENWENFRCGLHIIEAIIRFDGTTRTRTEEVVLSAENFDLAFSPDLETGKISPATRVEVNVKGVDGRGISYAKVIISDGERKRERETDDRGRISFRIADWFSPRPSLGMYAIKILKNEMVRGRYYCNYEKEFEVKKKLNISSIFPINPKVNERITLTLDADDYRDIWLTIEGPKPQYHILRDRTFYFTLDTPGTYKISVSKGLDYWTDERIITVEEYPELKIINFSEILVGREIEFVILDANNVRVPNAKVTLAGISKMSDSDGVVRFTITRPGSYEITAEKAGYKTGKSIYNILKKLKIAYEPEKPKIYDKVKIKLLDEYGAPVDGTIIIDNVVYSTRAGYITYNFTKFVSYKIIGKAQDFADVEVELKPLKILTITIKDEKEEFSVGEYLNIVLEGDDLINAQIEIKNLDTNTTLKRTLAARSYSMPLLAPGNYEITATAPGFGDAKKKFSVRRLTMEMSAKYDEKNNRILITVMSDGKGLENVTILIRTPKNLTAQYITNVHGQVIFEAIYEDGDYTVIAEKIHYETRQQIVKVKRQGFELVIFVVIILLIIAFLLILKKKRKKIYKTNEIQGGGLERY